MQIIKINEHTCVPELFKLIDVDAHESFSEKYMSGLTLFNAFAYIDNNSVSSIVTAYRSNTSPCWYLTEAYGNSVDASALDYVINWHEDHGYTQFYSLSTNYMSQYTYDKYTRYKSCNTGIKSKCKYTEFWAILYNHQLQPAATTVIGNVLHN